MKKKHLILLIAGGVVLCALLIWLVAAPTFTFYPNRVNGNLYIGGKKFVGCGHPEHYRNSYYRIPHTLTIVQDHVHTIDADYNISEEPQPKVWTELKAIAPYFRYEGTRYIVRYEESIFSIEADNDEAKVTTSYGMYAGDWDGSLTMLFANDDSPRLYFVYLRDNDGDSNDNSFSYRYDVRYANGNMVIAFDMEEGRGRHITLETPHELVLHVDESGIYTWRHEKSRVYHTTWDGESAPISDEIPFVPVYRTDEDAENENSANIWKAEVKNDEIILIDCTDDENYIELARVPLQKIPPAA